MDRAYSLLDIRSVNDDQRMIEGIASTPTADRMGDIVEPMGAKFALPMPFLWQHNSDAPVGHVEFAKPAKNGIPFKATLIHPDAVDSATLKDRLQLAWDSMKTRLVRAVSIGFRDLAHEVMKDGGWRFTEWEWLELSAVTIPANAEATINTIKAFDAEQLAASGRELPVTERREAIAEPKDQAASGQMVRVVKLNAPARARAPFVINRINRLR
jgi:HK97 family phage prohead protease